MTTITPTTSSFFAKCCPCNWKKTGEGHSWILPWIGIAISIIGVATMLFASSFGGAAGYALFGATVFHYYFSGETGEIEKLGTQIAQSDAQLDVKQKEIVSITAQLTALQKSSDQARLKFSATIDELKKTNTSFKQTIADLQKAETAFTEENGTLKITVANLERQLARSQVTDVAFEQQVKLFISQHQQLIPQLGQLSEIARRLEDAGQGFQATISGVDQTFKRNLENFSLGLRAWKEITEGMQTQNQALTSQVSKLQASLSKGEQTVLRLQEANRKMDETLKGREAQVARLQEIETKLIARDKLFHTQQDQLQKKLEEINAARAAFKAERAAAKNPVP